MDLSNGCVELGPTSEYGLLGGKTLLECAWNTACLEVSAPEQLNKVTSASSSGCAVRTDFR